MSLQTKMVLLLSLLFLPPPALELSSSSSSSPRRRRRQSIPEVEEAELDELVETESFVAVLYHDTSKLSQKTLHDLELIKGDSDAFGILWRRLQTMAPLELLEEEEEEGAMARGEEEARVETRVDKEKKKKKKIPPSTVIFYVDGLPIRYPGRPDRQTAVFRWLVTELFCQVDRPVEVDLGQFHILVRSFRTFVLLLHHPTVRAARTLLGAFQSSADLCHATDGVLVASAHTEEVARVAVALGRGAAAGAGAATEEAEAVFLNLPKVINIAHGISTEYEGDSASVEDILSWIRDHAHSTAKQLSQTNLERVLKREELLLVVFLKPPPSFSARGRRDDHHPIGEHPLVSHLKVSLFELETVFGLAVTTTSDPAVTTTLLGDGTGAREETSFPAIVLYDHGSPTRYPAPTGGEDAAFEVREWVRHRLETKDRVVFKAIESSEFKSHPDDFKNVLLKEHKDSIRILSMEYARLLKQNQKLKELIHKAQGVLHTALQEGTEEEEEVVEEEAAAENVTEAAADEAAPPEEQVKKTKKKKKKRKKEKVPGGAISAECGDCLAAVGQAVWNCGTLEAECIKNALALKSECFGCICEIFDAWWPDDAPNCYKKVIHQKISKKKQQKEDEEISLEDVVPEKVSKILKEDQKEREAPPFCPTVGNKNGNGKEEQENVWADEVMEEEEDYDGEQLPQNEEEENTDFLL